MLSNESIGKLFLASLCPIIATLIIEHYTSILPFGGICLALYILLLLSITIWGAWIGIQNVLQQNKPFSYNFEKNIYLKYVKKLYLYANSTSTESKLSAVNKQDNAEAIDNLLEEQKNIDDRILDFTKDIEKYFIMKWYTKITDDETFLSETRILLDSIIRRFLQIVVQVDNKKLVHGALIIFLKHIKEFRRSVKRRQNNSKAIDDIYRYIHVASTNEKAFEHFMCQITTKVFRQFLSWELFNSAPCKCLVSILAKKLTTYVLIYVTAPPTINYKIAQFCSSEEQRRKFNLTNYDSINLTDVDLMCKKEVTDDTSRSEVTVMKSNLLSNGNTPSATPKKVEIKSEFKNVENEKNIIERTTQEEMMKIMGRDEVGRYKHEEELQTDASHAVTAPVKIHKPQSSRTWRNSSDLECISLGQDLLVLQECNDPDLQIQDLIDRKPWKDNTDSLEVDEKHHPIWNITENLEEVLESRDLGITSQNIPSFISNTIKPIGNVTATTLHNMKELQQSTVNNVVKPVSQVTSTAMHKIGDLQDEAAGVMEGIFDFGMAGIRKGLRLTGLQDNIDKAKMDISKIPKSWESVPPVAHQKPHKVGKLAKVPHVMSEEAKTLPAQDENVWMNPLIKDSPNFDGEILLEKSPVAVPIIPTISTEEVTSPDPEYEDTTDLATTTAKLRILLEQKTSESVMNTPAVSPIPPDESNKSFSSPLEYRGSNSVDDIDGALPSLYKFCARTATGVFQNTLNTLKTALPGNITDQEHRQDAMVDRNWDAENWMYVASDAGTEDFTSRTHRLLTERRAFCTVDNAYEAVESLDVLDQVEAAWTTPTATYDDELDDLEVHTPFTKALVDIFCETVSETDTFLVQESVVKILLILFGDLTEEYICNASVKITKSISSIVGKLPNEPKKDSLSLTLDEFARLCLNIFPNYAKTIIGETTLISAAKALLLSLQNQKINQDVCLQLFELIASLLIEASNKMTPAYSA